MSRWGAPKRTQADKLRDLIVFLNSARPDIVLAATADQLAARYGTPVKDTEYHLRIAQQRLERVDG